MAMKLKNFNTIVAGATGALGREVVSTFLNHGADVVVNYRNEQKFNDLKEYCGNNENLKGIQADFTSEAQVQEFFRKFDEEYKRLDVFLHIMGGFWMGKEVVDTPLDTWQKMLDLNLNSAFLCTREAFRMMKAQCHGKIFTVSAKAALDLPPQMGAYTISKAAVLALSQTLAIEGKQYGIQVNSLLPSIIDTGANRKAMPDANYDNWVNPKDIADMLVQLSQPEQKVLSHTAIKVYGKL